MKQNNDTSLGHTSEMMIKMMVYETRMIENVLETNVYISECCENQVQQFTRTFCN